MIPFTITGENFTNTGTMMTLASSSMAKAPTPDGTLADAQIQDINSTGNGTVVTLPSSLPTNSMYFVWGSEIMEATGGTETASAPIAINQTQVQWVGTPGRNRQLTTRITANSNRSLPNSGGTLSVYGQNLSNGAASPLSWVYLQPTAAARAPGQP